jgi:regulator of cell morphogenesis and NO signaling
MTITETTTVAEIAAFIPSSTRVFERHGIDFCCGGRRPLAAVCEEQGLSFAGLLGEVDEGQAPRETGRDWTAAPLHELIDHIVATYHQPLRAELPRLTSLAGRVLGAHGDRDRQTLTRIETIVEELSAELQDHMRKEELVLFPAIRMIEQGGVPAVRLDGPVSVMEAEHDHAGTRLAELRHLTSGYVVPTWACPTTRALIDGLRELEADMHQHVHLENNILFPRAQQRS